ncbi:hypothetical protein BCL80_11572 [Streptomyces avidinii]|nr:hypothetical protein [Streptomyces pratensis]RAS23974.1 hypothetical protein BCL80_11572 [Streptomyces avidinii]SNX80877.1 hypothetical protein SAMN05421860_11372 [Streptomyces microflavus]
MLRTDSTTHYDIRLQPTPTPCNAHQRTTLRTVNHR